LEKNGVWYMLEEERRMIYAEGRGEYDIHWKMGGV
jgi:hypothetical protein